MTVKAGFFSRAVACILLSATVAACSSFDDGSTGNSVAVASGKPNVLLIIADDMGLDASACYSLGNQQASMPNIEAMCANGMVFDNAYAAPVCSPTRATMMTGQYGFRTGVGAAIPPNGTNGLSADTPSLFDAFAGTGYSSNVIGKWHLAGQGSGYDQPNQLGVSNYFGLFSGATRNYSKWTAIEDGNEVDVNAYTTTVFTDRAIDWIAEQEKPWFLWLAYNAPHAPFHLPPANLHSADDLPTDEQSIADNPLPYYNAMLEALDTEIGRLLASMSDAKRANTVIIFMGDNGSPNQVTRGFYGDHAAKGTIYEGGTHVPFIVSGPGVKTGRTDAFVNSSDMFATVAKIAGSNAGGTDTFDFAPALSGGTSARDYVYVEHFSDSEPKPSDVFGWAIREGNYKLVNKLDDQQELYDVVSDPRESKDLLAGGGDDTARATASRLARKAASIRSD